MSKFCDLNANIKHIGEVSTSRVDGSPTGAEILTSTNGVTGDVRDTIDGKFKKMDQQFQDRFNTLAPITWTPNTEIKANQSLQVFEHDGLFYLPNVKKLPFITGATFNADNWSLSKLLTSNNAVAVIDSTEGFKNISANVGDIIRTRSFYSDHACGGADYEIFDGISINNIVTFGTSNGRVAKLVTDGSNRLTQLGAVNDAVHDKETGVVTGTNSIDAIQWAFNNVAARIIVDGSFYANGTLLLNRGGLSILGFNKFDSRIYAHEIKSNVKFMSNFNIRDFSIFSLRGVGLNLASLTQQQAFYTSTINRMHIYGRDGAILCQSYSDKGDTFYESTISNTTVSYATGGGVINCRSTRAVCRQVTNVPSDDDVLLRSGDAPIFSNPSCKLEDCNLGYGDVGNYVKWSNPSDLASFRISKIILDNCNFESARKIAIEATDGVNVDIELNNTELVNYSAEAAETAICAVRIPNCLRFSWSGSVLNYSNFNGDSTHLLQLGITPKTIIDVSSGMNLFTDRLNVLNLTTNATCILSSRTRDNTLPVGEGFPYSTDISKQLSNIAVPESGVRLLKFRGNSAKFIADLSISGIYSVGVANQMCRIACSINNDSTGTYAPISVAESGASTVTFAQARIKIDVVFNGGWFYLTLFTEKEDKTKVRTESVYLNITGVASIFNYTNSCAVVVL